MPRFKITEIGESWLDDTQEDSVTTDILWCLSEILDGLTYVEIESIVNKGRAVDIPDPVLQSLIDDAVRAKMVEVVSE